jgi:hypothetical protein
MTGHRVVFLVRLILPWRPAPRMDGMLASLAGGSAVRMFFVFIVRSLWFAHRMLLG